MIYSTFLYYRVIWLFKFYLLFDFSCSTKIRVLFMDDWIFIQLMIESTGFDEFRLFSMLIKHVIFVLM
jgi:hypothetical protein